MVIFGSTLGGKTYQIVEPDINELGQTPYSELVIPTFTTPYTLSNSVYSGFSAINLSGETVGAGNYTIDGTSFNLTNNEYDGQNLTVGYTYINVTIQNSIRSSITNTFNSLNTTTGYIALVVLGVVITLVLGMVFMFTNVAQKQGGGGNAL